MGVAEYQLFHHAVDDIFHGETAGIGLNVGMEHHLHQHIAQFLTQQSRILPVDGLHRLIRLLQEAAANGFVGLFLIPGTALRRAQQMDNFQQIFVTVTRFQIKIYHTYTPIARGFPNTPGFPHFIGKTSASFSPLGRARTSSRFTAPSSRAAAAYTATASAIAPSVARELPGSRRINKA